MNRKHELIVLTAAFMVGAGVVQARGEQGGEISEAGKAIDPEQYGRAAQLLTPLAEHISYTAQCLLGDLYEYDKGQGATRDFAKAVELYEIPGPAASLDSSIKARYKRNPSAADTEARPKYLLCGMQLISGKEKTLPTMQVMHSSNVHTVP